MKKTVEISLVEPLYSTYHNGILSAVIGKNPSVRNWFLSNTVVLCCTKKFLSGFTTPEIRVENYSFDNPCLETKWISMESLDENTNPTICQLLDEGYCVHFTGVDDYYVSGKSWYNERHFCHDGAICGYNQNDETYCIYAYDSNWIYQKFWTPQKGFNAGRFAMSIRGVAGNLCAIKVKADTVAFSAETALRHIVDYLKSDFEKYPENTEDHARGIVVHAYIAKYIDKLFDGSIPYERMDRRVFRLIWEHKKVMLERIEMIEKALSLNNAISCAYTPLVDDANTMRMLYASHHMKRRDSILPIIQKKLLALSAKERELLSTLVKDSEKELKNEAMEIH